MLRQTDVADALGVSAWILSSRLKRATGRSFPQHLNDVRCLLGRALLAGTTTAVSDIATAVGYRRASEFNRHFKNRFGETPSAWRTDRISGR